MDYACVKQLMRAVGRTRFAAANVASLPANHLAPGQSAAKLRDDIFAAKNSADLLSEMLAPISIHDPADVKQVCMLGS